MTPGLPSAVAPTDAWIARLACASCTAARWIFAASIGMGLVALAWEPGPAPAIVAALAIVQVYLAARVEFDRAIFAALAADPGEARAFDAALAAAGAAVRDGERTMASRAAGVRRFIAAAVAVFVAQCVVAAAGAWLR